MPATEGPNGFFTSHIKIRDQERGGYSQMSIQARMFTIALSALFASGCGDPQPAVQEAETAPAIQPVADSVYLNGRIYTMDSVHGRVEAVAVADGKFLHTGTNTEMQAFIDEATVIIDLDGQFIIPGMFDSHLHPVEGMMQQLFQCNFPFSYTLDEVIAAVKQCAEEHPDWPWITGGQWNASVLTRTIPTREMLDAVVSDRPVYLTDATYHHGWANSRALELAGVTAATVDPPGGVIVRNGDTGEPAGVLLETATALVERFIPAFSEDRLLDAALAIQQKMNAFGFTGMKSAITPRERLQALHRLDSEGRLTMRIAAHLTYIHESADPDKATIHEQTIRDREMYAGRLLRTDFIKIMLDGVPPSHTAAYLEPYADRPDQYGEIMMPQEELEAASVRFDGQGLTIKYHAAGDAAARAAIDAIEAARNANGHSGLYHEIGHASLIHPDDIQRLAALGGAAEVSPILWYPSPFVAEGHYMLGEQRLEHLWPVKSYLDAGILTVAGSDWPAAVDSPNPWPAIEALITRRNPFGEMPEETLGERNAIDLESALRMYTQNGAIAMRIGDTAGSIETGKSADMIVLDRDLFAIPVEDISDTRVNMTIFQGRIVYHADN